MGITPTIIYFKLEFSYIFKLEKKNIFVLTYTIIRYAPNFRKDINKVEQFFKENIENRDKIEEYIINLLGNAYTEYEINNLRVGYKSYQNGLYLWKGNYLNRTEECFKSWSDITENYISILSINELEKNFNLLTENEQKQNIAEAENASVFSFTQDMIDCVLQEGSHFDNGKFRIYEQFNKSLSSQENAEFLKNEYGTGGRSADHNGVMEDYNSKGIVLSFAHNEGIPNLRLTWMQVEKRIRELISADRYLTNMEKDEYYDWLNANDRKEENTKIENQINDVEYQHYEYNVGDIVYIGTKEYSIIEIEKERVLATDTKFPILVEEFDRKQFDKRVNENPFNDKLRTKIKIQEKIENTPIDNIENKQDSSSFEKWLDIFIEEKGIDLNEVFSIETNREVHYFEIGNVIENIKATSKEEQEEIRKMIVKIDFNNADVVDYFKHLAQALVQNYQREEQINASENIEQTDNKLIPNIKKRQRNKIEYFDLHPEIPLKNRNNYKITNNNLGEGTKKEKFKKNVEAIEVLKKCENENRYATNEEQEVLAQYVGWGGLAEAFDYNNDEWSNEFKELSSLLTEKEYSEAKESTLTSFYTPPIVINAIYEALEKMGLKQGNILEPSCRYWEFYGNATK